MFKTLLALLMSSSTAFAASQCPNLYPNSKQIGQKEGIELCNAMFVTVYDSTKTRAVFSSESLPPKLYNVTRTDHFHRDSRADAVGPTDYSGSGYDRGHLVPAEDAFNDLTMDESFLMTNMTPQNPKLNRGSWRVVENAARNKVVSSGKTAWIVTGAIYGDSKKTNKGIPVPTQYFKCVYGAGQTCWLTPNVSGGKIAAVPYSKIKALAPYLP